MGINIHIVEVKNEDVHSYVDVSEQVGWDYFRYVYDKEFHRLNLYQEKVIGCNTPYCCGAFFTRPESFNDAKEAIKKGIPLGYQERYLKLISILEMNGGYYMDVSL